MPDQSPPPAFRIDQLPVPNRVLLAPMSGVSDLPFRRIAHRLGAGLVFSEMVAGDRLLAGDIEATSKADCADMTPRAVQLAGCRADYLAEAARFVEASGADLVDINMGCPAKKVTGGLAGSALMRDLDHAVSLIRAVVAAVSLPVTVKMRLGWDEASINAPELARRAEQEGVRMVTVHGRTRQQFYKGQANWDAIRDVVDAVAIPVVANGDCATATDARAMLDRSGAAAIMVGRAATGRPWLPGALARALDAGDAEVASPDMPALAAISAEHFSACVDHYGADVGVRTARKHLAAALDHAVATGCVDNRPTLRRAILTEPEPEAVMRLLAIWFEQPLKEQAA